MVLYILFILWTGRFCTAQIVSETQIEYTVFLRPHQFECDITMDIKKDNASNEFLLQTPFWVPGDYVFDDYGRDVFKVRAFDGRTGESLLVKRNGQNGYRIISTSEDIKVTYTAYFYDPDLSDGSGAFSSNFAIILGNNLLHAPLYKGPLIVHYQGIPDGWKVYHPAGSQKLSKKAGQVSWKYPNYEILLDTPVVFGTFKEIKKEVMGTPFSFIYVNETFGFNKGAERLANSLVQVAQEAYRIFGHFPFSQYGHILNFNPTFEWGLEHLTSNMSTMQPNIFIDEESFSEGLRIAAHEFFHAWNVRRLRPKPFGRIIETLQTGGFTEGLWIAEGFTRYYEILLTTRAEAYDTQQFLSNVIEFYQHLVNQPAYKRVSTIDASLTAFLNHYQYPGRVNNSVNYYDEGMLIAFIIDVILRTSGTGQSLDSVFAEFYQKFNQESPDVPSNFIGYTIEDFTAFLNQKEEGLGDIVFKLASEPGNLNLELYLQKLGIKLNYEDTFYLGIFFYNGGQPVIYNIADNSPAGKAGIAPEDMILSINSFAFSYEGLEWAASQNKKVTLGIQRGNQILSFEMIPERTRQIKSFTWVGNEKQKKVIQSWLNQPKFSPDKGQEFSLNSYYNPYGVEERI